MDYRKVLIIVPSFDSGGTITSLCNFITLVDKKRFNINVFAITNTGVNKNYIAEQCIIVGDAKDSKTKLSWKDRFRNSAFAFIKSIKKGVEKMGLDLSPLLFRVYASKLDKANYDFVIAFQEGQATLFGSFFRHGKKIAWVRSEYSRFIKAVKPRYSKVYDKYDTIVSVSRSSLGSFITCLPQYKDKAVLQYNFLNDERIIKMAQQPAERLEDSDVFTIISVGRIDPVKRFSEIPRIARALLNKGLHFRWLILGGVVDNKEYDLLMKNIQAYYTNNVYILGNRSNPYPFIKKSNLLVSLSSSETFNNTLTEAKILGVPVVTTDYPCAFESISNGIDGYISSFEAIEQTLSTMILNKDGKYNVIKENLAVYKYDKEGLLKNLYTKVLR